MKKWNPEWWGVSGVSYVGEVSETLAQTWLELNPGGCMQEPSFLLPPGWDNVSLTAVAIDSSHGVSAGLMGRLDSGRMTLYCSRNAQLLRISSTNPFTWAAGDRIQVSLARLKQ